MTDPIEQIPWAEKTKVTHFSGLSIVLEREPKLDTADIWNANFEWSVSINSKIIADDWLTLDTKLTRDIQDHFETYKEPASFRDKILSWLRNGTVNRSLPREGPKEWRPPIRGRRARKSPWKLDQYGYGNTYNEDNTYYWGDVFEFAHFQTDDSEEGAVILWQGGGDYGQPQVYLGSFEEFMAMQYEHDPRSTDTFLNWNSHFENGFMWAWEKMGVFDEPAEKIKDLSDRHVKQVLEAIEKDPSILLPESVEKILENFDEFPVQIKKAVTWLMANHRRDLEKALGQKLIWGDLYSG